MFANPYTFLPLGANGDSLVSLGDSPAGLYYVRVTVNFTGIDAGGVDALLTVRIRNYGTTLVEQNYTIPVGTSTLSASFVYSGASAVNVGYNVFVYSTNSSFTTASNASYLDYSYI
jgi:hemolysin activation/secretion protein